MHEAALHAKCKINKSCFDSNSRFSISAGMVSQKLRINKCFNSNNKLNDAG